ncbi:uncharacterized protein LOC103524116 [Trichonephila clavipes]|nr:uncharacterized protein LOC103524116 [Trichonephila clavipes]
MALSNYNENNCLRVQNCRELLGKIKGKIVFQWVPSHCGLWGNERADFFLAKKGTGILQNFRRDLTLHSAKLKIKSIFRESFRLTASRVARDKPWSTLCKKSHGIPSSPRAAAVAKFRLLTGHDCLCAHLFRFNLVTSPICVLCDTGQDMTAAHLDECSALNDLNCIVKRTHQAGLGRRSLAGVGLSESVRCHGPGLALLFNGGLQQQQYLSETVHWLLPENRKMKEQKINLFCFKLGKTPKETYVILVLIHEDQALFRKFVYEWFTRFREGRESVSDHPRSGRPATPVSDENIQKRYLRQRGILGRQKKCQKAFLSVEKWFLPIVDLQQFLSTKVD